MKFLDKTVSPLGLGCWPIGGKMVTYVDSPCVNNKFALIEEIDAYLCTSSQLSSELRLFDIYADVFSNLLNELKALRYKLS